MFSMVKRKSYYAVRLPFKKVYKDWATCKRSIRDLEFVSYRKFSTMDEAKQFIDAEEQVNPSSDQYSRNKFNVNSSISVDKSQVLSKKASISIPQQSINAISTRSTRSKKSKIPSSSERTPVLYIHPEHNEEFQRIWTDGSCLNNGRKEGVIGGIGVYFGDNDERNISEPLYLQPDEINSEDNLTVPTNNKAELLAILRALESVDTEMNLDIHTDSQYSINSLTVWIKNWKKRNWTSSSNKPVQNKSIIQKIDRIMSTRKGRTIFTYVRGHADIYENEQADQLAREGGLKTK